MNFNYLNSNNKYRSLINLNFVIFILLNINPKYYFLFNYEYPKYSNTIYSVSINTN